MPPRAAPGPPRARSRSRSPDLPGTPPAQGSGSLFVGKRILEQVRETQDLLVQGLEEQSGTLQAFRERLGHQAAQLDAFRQRLDLQGAQLSALQELVVEHRAAHLRAFRESLESGCPPAGSANPSAVAPGTGGLFDLHYSYLAGVNSPRGRRQRRQP